KSVAENNAKLSEVKAELQPLKDVRYWISKVIEPEQGEVEKKPEPKHSVTEKMKYLQEQKKQLEPKSPQHKQKKQNMEL
ncbi:TPA: conjugal transfer protein, partial [Clostridioides difficile]|nr:conjugal transfer protein [Clostridioides difficile]